MKTFLKKVVDIAGQRCIISSGPPKKGRPEQLKNPLKTGEQMNEIKWKIGTLKVDSAAQIVMGRPAKSYLDGLKSASSTGMKDGDGDTHAIVEFDI